MAARKPTAKTRITPKGNANTKASAKRFASAFYRKHGEVMSKLSRA